MVIAAGAITVAIGMSVAGESRPALVDRRRRGVRLLLRQQHDLLAAARMRARQLPSAPPASTRAAGRTVRGVLPDRVHDPAHQPFRPSSAQPHRFRALRLLSAAPVALAEDLLDLLPADRVLLGDHSGRRPHLPGLAVRVPQPRVSERPGELVGVHRIRPRYRRTADRTGMAAGAVHVRAAGAAVVEPRARAGPAGSPAIGPSASTGARCNTPITPGARATCTRAPGTCGSGR